MPYKKVTLSENNNTGVVYMYDTYYDYLGFIDEQFKNIDKNPTSNAFKIKEEFLSNKGIQWYITNFGAQWFGTTDVSEVSNEITSFLMPDELQTETQELIKQTLPSIDFDLEQKKQLEFTSQEIGIFSFDLASLGLIRVFEYYSPLLKRNVDANYVKSYKVDDNKLVFYHVYVAEVPEHILEQRNGKLFSTLLNTFIERSDAAIRTDKDGNIYFVHPFASEIAKHDVERIQKRNEDGSLKFSSTWKKSFIYIPVQENHIPQLDLFFVTSFAAARNARTEIFWNAVLLNALIELMSKANIRFRVFAGIGNIWRNSDLNIGFTKVKDVNDALDANIISILSGDARSFRFNGFKFYLAGAWESKLDRNISSSFGTVVTNETQLKNALIETLVKTNDFGSSREDTVNPRTKILVPPVTNIAQARDAILSVIRQIEGVSNQPQTP
jgi:hypothetical protein